MKKESQIQKEIIVWLETNGFMVIRNHTQGVKYTNGRGSNPNKGLPDLAALKYGKWTFIEVKTPKGKLSEGQVSWIERAISFGAHVLVASDVSHVSQFMDEHYT